MRLLASAKAGLTAHWRFKVGLSAMLSLLFAVPYFTLQHVVLFPIRTLGLSPVDNAVRFDERWVWMYQSVYLLVAIVPWLATDRGHLRRYARGFVLLSMVGFVCFLLVPVAGPRPETVPTSDMFAWLVWYDRPTNTIPSLHVGLAAYSVFFCACTSHGALDSTARRWLLSVGSVWVGAIALAALATKQHYAMDLPPGLLAAWMSHRWAWRSSR